MPALFLAACEIDGEIEMYLEGSRIIIEPVSTYRAGWFDNLQSKKDEDAWKEMEEIDNESEEWGWLKDGEYLARTLAFLIVRDVGLIPICPRAEITCKMIWKTC